MNFVWVYYHGGAKKDEIRFSVRSVEANFDGPVKITIVGDRPPWYTGHHIPVKRIPSQSFRAFRDSLNKLTVAVNHPEIDPEFVWMMDDVYITSPVNRDDLATPRHMGKICERRAERLKGNKWQRLKARTAKMLGLPVWDYATHLPHVLEKDKFKFILNKYDMPSTLWLWELVYGAEFYKHPQPYSPFLTRTQRRLNYSEIAGHFSRSCIFNHVNKAWNEDLRAALLDRFPTKSPTEEGETVGTRPDFVRPAVAMSPSIKRREPPRVVAVVPYRKTPDREPARRWVREYLDNRADSVHFSDCDGEVFNRSAAINNAVRLADPKPDDVLAIVDADCFITSKRWREGSVTARETGRLVIPHDSICRMTESQSAEVLRDRCPNRGPSGKWYRKTRGPKVVSGVIFIRFDSFKKINGFDERFVGWGGEDNAFKIAASEFLGPLIRLDGPLFHFYHTRAEGRNIESEQYEANRRRWLEYRNAAECFIFYKVSEAGFAKGPDHKLGENWEVGL